MDIGIYAKREGESLEKNIEQENENLGSTDKDWKRCCVCDSSLNITQVLQYENDLLPVYK